MARRLTFRQLLLLFLAAYDDLSQKEIGARAGLSPKNLSLYLTRREIRDELFDQLLEAMRPRPAVVRILTAALEALEALEQAGDLSEEDLEVIEEGVLVVARLVREDLIEALRRARALPAGGYPELADLTAFRLRAERQWERLKELPEDQAQAVVRVAEEFQTWALCEKVCEESVRQASRDVKRAAALARLAGEIAERVQGPEDWCNRIRGYAAAHGPNILRVAGELPAADVGLEEAKRLWLAGSDPLGVLDPGRLFDLEASLRRDQRRFDEALTLLDKALAVGSSLGRVLVNKGFTLEAMGEYGRAVETLQRAIPRIDPQTQPRLWNIVRLNLANCLSLLSRYEEATALVADVKPLVAELGDKIDLTRVLGLEGRIEAGLGRREKARRLLGESRRRFAAEGMSYDVALLLLEEAVLFLDEGRTAEVKALARELSKVFNSKGVHREALAALRLFQEAAERETATAALARNVLRYLFRARHDQSLRFSDV